MKLEKGETDGWILRFLWVEVIGRRVKPFRITHALAPSHDHLSIHLLSYNHTVVNLQYQLNWISNHLVANLSLSGRAFQRGLTTAGDPPYLWTSPSHDLGSECIRRKRKEGDEHQRSSLCQLPLICFPTMSGWVSNLSQNKRFSP